MSCPPRHGHALKGNASPTYVVWQNMITRCTNASHINYAYYGGRGVTVAPQWRDFAVFLADMGERPRGMSLDRYPNREGNYEPGNCRWATRAEQQRNRTDTWLNEQIVQDMREMAAAGFGARAIAAMYGVNHGYIWQIINNRIWV